MKTKRKSERKSESPAVAQLAAAGLTHVGCGAPLEVREGASRGAIVARCPACGRSVALPEIELPAGLPAARQPAAPRLRSERLLIYLRPDQLAWIEGRLLARGVSGANGRAGKRSEVVREAIDVAMRSARPHAEDCDMGEDCSCGALKG